MTAISPGCSLLVSVLVDASIRAVPLTPGASDSGFFRRNDSFIIVDRPMTPVQMWQDPAVLRRVAELLRTQLDQKAYEPTDRKSTRLNSSHVSISYAVFCLKKQKTSV